MLRFKERRMEKGLKLLMVVLATCVGLTWGGVTAEAAPLVKSLFEGLKQVTKFKIQGDGAFAHFVNSDECGGTSDVQVGANDEAIKEGSGKAEFTSSMFLNIYFNNYCTGQFVS